MVLKFQRTLSASSAAVALLAGGLHGTAQAFDFQFLATPPSPFTANCNGTPQTGTLYPNAEVEPTISVNPRNPLNLIGVWQQDRWSNGGSQGLGTGFSFDGGITWQQRYQPISRCAGGNASNNGDYARASDPWISFSPNGVAHFMSLSVSGTAFEADGLSAMLATRSTDGGRTWSQPITLVRDAGETLFNDKNSITADPTDSRYVYAIWDRLNINGGGPTLLARSIDNGVSWQPTRAIYDPGPDKQTIGNLIVVLPSGIVVNFFTQIDQITGASFFAVIRSTDKGQTWSQPVKIADDMSIGTKDPETGAAVRDGAGIGSIAVSKNGQLYAVWADSRFSGGARDGIALSSSQDGGLTWAAPKQINRAPNAPAFTPTVHVRYDGVVGVTYYDFRSNTTDPATLPTEHWLTRSSDGGKTWRESRVGKQFDLVTAPVARGLFLGDYQGLTSIGPIFVPFFAKTTGDLNNRNDVFSTLAVSLRRNADSGNSLQIAKEEEAKLPAIAAAQEVTPMQMTPELQKQIGLKNKLLMQRRVDKWAETVKMPFGQ